MDAQPKAGTAFSAGHLLWLVRSGRARTRGELQQLTGLSRSTIGQRLDALSTAGYLHESGVDESTGGRRPTILRFDDRHRVVLTADLGATHARLAVLDIAGAVLADHTAPLRIADGPVKVLNWVSERFTTLLHATGRTHADTCGLGLGVPGPVEFEVGRVRQPPIMPGWDDHPIAEHLRHLTGGPILVDNDANLMSLGEHTTNHPHSPALILIKVSTGIGAGVVINGQVYRGIDGGAGDIGHIRLHGHDDALCMCGSRGCLASVASGNALARRLTEQGVPTATSRDLLNHINAGHPAAARLAREAGQLLGEVLATVVCLLNPGTLLIAGDLNETNFLTGVREALYRQALPRATRHLHITPSTLGHDAAIRGAHAMVVETVFDPAAVDAALATR